MTQTLAAGFTVHALERLVQTDAHEGPVYVAEEDALYFTTEGSIRRLDIGSKRITVVRSAANMANGMTLSPDGRLLVCEQGTRSEPAAISAVDRVTGERTVLVDQWGGLPLNSPNDVVVRRDGTIWFTDPTYGHLQGFRPEPRIGDHVYRYDPASDRLSVVADSFDKPNGLAFSPDERTLYVGDSGANQTEGSYHPDRPHHVIAFDVVDGRRLVNDRRFAVTTPGFPDGLKVDSAGRVYVSAFGRVQVFDPAGELIGEIEVPGAVNFTFGGPDRNVLFITADDAIWAAELGATGPPTTPPPMTEEPAMSAVRTRRIIDNEGTDAVLAAAEREAIAKGYRVVIVVVDPSGEVLALRRTPGAQIASSRVAVDKARTAAIFVRPSREIEQQVTDGRLGALALHGAAALTGGIPLKVDGEVVGAVGTSGETPDEDESVSIAAAATSFSTAEVPALTYEGARMAAEAVGAAAEERGVAPVVSVVDAGGELMFLLRPDQAQVASVQVTTDKARTAAIYRRPSRDFEEQASGGRPSALHLARAVPLQGGMPIEADGDVIGAVGVSGASSADEDQELAVIGVQAADAAVAVEV